VIHLACGDDHREASIREVDGGLQVTVDGEAFRIQVEEFAPGSFVVRRPGGCETFHCVGEAGAVHLWWRGVSYRLDRLDERARRSGHRSHAGDLTAPMPGKVIAVKAAPGQPVARGDEILVVEAMKMENAIRAPRDGRIRSIAVAVGDAVTPGMVLAELE
jgi:biotin carboxyl carrier protein